MRIFPRSPPLLYLLVAGPTAVPSATRVDLPRFDCGAVPYQT